MSNRIPVGVLGATGAVGQKFVALLENHPWFELTELAASDRSAGKSYKDATVWRQYQPIPERLKDRTIKPCEPELDCRVVVSGLGSSAAAKKRKWRRSRLKSWVRSTEMEFALRTAELVPTQIAYSSKMVIWNVCRLSCNAKPSLMKSRVCSPSSARCLKS